MTRRKELLAAGYIRDIQFRTSSDYEAYVSNIRGEFKILETYKREDGSVITRILQQYNSAPLVQLYEE